MVHVEAAQSSLTAPCVYMCFISTDLVNELLEVSLRHHPCQQLQRPQPDGLVQVAQAKKHQVAMLHHRLLVCGLSEDRLGVGGQDQL